MTQDTIIKLQKYAELLGEANKKARLTGPSDPSTLFREHIADAISGLPYLPEGCSFVDIGTGGGLPGLVWCICRPHSRGVLLDSVGKKITLLTAIAQELGCSNAEPLRMRSEDFARTHRESFGAATARAVAHSCALAEYMSPLVATGGRLIAFKGPNAGDELDVPDSRWKKLGLGRPEQHNYNIEGKARLIIVWEKIGKCPAQYPRKSGDALKNPWWR
ncbi:MAG: 16S rRNA (guanine(527)-N(7))-methyltransferase RsmG [Synergistaceae bacterium]|jgi:16S rRNA (guanine527-N7)-methyltransferase|nr:16S rRNA (guanine(527)-N(7))-methyltransferase RsmG [Synergistaceae bacterium]